MSLENSETQEPENIFLDSIDCGEPTPTPTPSSSSAKRIKREVTAPDDPIVIPKKPMNKLQNGFSQMNSENKYQKFADYVAAELRQVQEVHGTAVADKILRKLNAYLIQCLDEIDS